jgi:hypothetical protein
MPVNEKNDGFVQSVMPLEKKPADFQRRQSLRRAVADHREIGRMTGGNPAASCPVRA